MSPIAVGSAEGDIDYGPSVEPNSETQVSQNPDCNPDRPNSSTILSKNADGSTTKGMNYIPVVCLAQEQHDIGQIVDKTQGTRSIDRFTLQSSRKHVLQVIRSKMGQRQVTVANLESASQWLLHESIK